MSLFLGNLPPDIRKDELERVFWRFGRCTVQRKDKYGFVVFDFRSDAERALSELKGRKICGHFISLSWSINQPGAVQGSSSAARSHDAQYGRSSDRVDDHIDHNVSSGRGNYRMRDQRTDFGGGRQHYAQEYEDRGSFNQNNKRIRHLHEKEDFQEGHRFNHNNKRIKHHHQKEEFLEEGDHIELNHVGNERWDEQVGNLQNGNDDRGHVDFDRYVPIYGDERAEEYKRRGVRQYDGSSSRDILVDKNKRGHHFDNVRGHHTCFRCGAAGHKVRDCPIEDSSQGKRLGSEVNFRSRGWQDVGRRESRSSERLQPSSRDYRSARQQVPDRNPSHSEYDDVGKKRRERVDQHVVQSDFKKSQELSASHQHPDHASPQLATSATSSNPSRGSRSRSRSRSPTPRPQSPDSRSKSRSNRSRTRSMKSSSRSESASPSSSLSISSGRSSPSSPKRDKLIVDGAGNIQELETDIMKEKISDENEAEMTINGRIGSSTRNHVKDVLYERHLRQQLEAARNDNPIPMNCGEADIDGSLNDDQNPECPGVLLEEKQLIAPDSAETVEPPVAEDISSSPKLMDDGKIDQLKNDYCESEIPCLSLLEQGDRDDDAGKVSALKLIGTEQLENGSVEAQQSDQNVPSKPLIGRHLNVNGDELCRVLKHYGLKYPEEGELVSPEDFFGSARLWPWEMIYYRRLKKGPISTENYAIRVAQNQELGIVDKYIRSSSGWYESIEEHC